MTIFIEGPLLKAWQCFIHVQINPYSHSRNASVVISLSLHWFCGFLRSCPSFDLFPLKMGKRFFIYLKKKQLSVTTWIKLSVCRNSTPQRRFLFLVVSNDLGKFFLTIWEKEKQTSYMICWLLFKPNNLYRYAIQLSFCCTKIWHAWLFSLSLVCRDVWQGRSSKDTSCHRRALRSIFRGEDATWIWPGERDKGSSAEEKIGRAVVFQRRLSIL